MLIQDHMEHPDLSSHGNLNQGWDPVYWGSQICCSLSQILFEKELEKEMKLWVAPMIHDHNESLVVKGVVEAVILLEEGLEDQLIEGVEF